MKAIRSFREARLGRRTLLGATLALTMTTAACDDEDLTPADDPTIAELAAETPQLSTLTAALQAAGLVDALDGEGPYTVFAPIDPAFAALGQERIERLLAEGNEELLARVLTYHVVPGEIFAEDLVDGATVTTLEGSQLTIDLDGGATVNGVQIVQTDIEAENGVVHLIGGVLTQNLDIVDVAVVEGFDALVDAVEAAGLTGTLRGSNDGQGFTVFAPTDDAFAALPSVPSDPAVLSDILLYHVASGVVLAGDLSDGQVITTAEGSTVEVDISGGDVTLLGQQSDADVLVTDVPASNGVIHAIGAVLLP